jgi:hypothetical protein
MAGIGLSYQELQREIDLRMRRMDESQEDDDQLGQFGDLLRMAAMIAFQRAAELIDLNNERIAEQLRERGIEV